ncbi:hypothetical protein LXL04_027717 [Taraxacum kok-saghyz]
MNVKDGSIFLKVLISDQTCMLLCDTANGLSAKPSSSSHDSLQSLFRQFDAVHDQTYRVTHGGFRWKKEMKELVRVLLAGEIVGQVREYITDILPVSLDPKSVMVKDVTG